MPNQAREFFLFQFTLLQTPADWQPGDDVIVPPAGSCGVAKDRMEGKEKEVICHDWFFCTKPLPKETVLKTVLKK